jgi:hypothetical protein
MLKNRSSKRPEFSKCKNCGAVAVVMGGQNPKMYLVDAGVCIACVAEIVGRYSAEGSYKRLTPESAERKTKKRYRKRPKTKTPE